MTLCEDCIHVMVWAETGSYYDDGYGIRPARVNYCGKTRIWIECGVFECKYRQTDDAEYRRLQQPAPQMPGKVYRWDCCTISLMCLECEHYHKPSEGTEPHKCPKGLKQRLRRIG